MMRLFFVIFFVIAILCSGQYGFSQITFPNNSEFKYLKGSKASSLDANWSLPGFNDSGWATGKAPFRYGKGSGGTIFSDMQNSYSTIYLRRSFSVANADKIEKITFTINYDDGFAIWINGNVVISQNVPNTLAYNAFATTTHEYDQAYTTTVDVEGLHLVEGENTIAVQIFNVTIGSSDIFFDVGMSASPVLPELVFEGDGVVFSKNAGFYSSAFDLTLSSSDNSCNMVYTTDGSNPATSPNAITVAAKTAVTVHVDPDQTTSGRGKTPAFVVKASLSKAGYALSAPVAKTFIFTDKVSDQSSPGGSWPAGYVNNQVVDYDMASDVVTDSRYKSQMSAALLAIPSISLSTDLDNLFGKSNGIYVNASQKGDAWERACSVELIDPEGKERFQANAGLRIRGGNSAKNGDNPKHAFRLFFRDEYGAKKLKYPLFGKAGASEFDCIDLRCEQNYSWSMDGSPHNTMVKDIFCRDLQGLMGQPHARGNYYHLYLNGMYWGVFQTDERPEASFAESYLGGDKEDYDIVKVNTQPWPYYNEVTDGNMDAWEELWALCKSGFETNKKYFCLEGKDENGNRVENSTVWVDIDNLIDYMLVIFYSGNFDAPVSAWYSNDMPNNFFAIYNRKNKSEGFKFVAHDSEHCMFVDKVNVDNGIDENRVNIGSNGSMKIGNVLDFNPQWLHYKLSSNAEYRLRFADRAAKYFADGGLLSPSETKALFADRASEIDVAIIAESARWGDAQSWGSLTRDDDWIPELNDLYQNYFPYRSNIVIQQLKDEGLYSSYTAPVVTVSGATVTDDTYYFPGSVNVAVTSANSSGEIFYTIDGHDPRLVGGSISANALSGGGRVNLTVSSTTILMAREKIGADWGPLRSVIFSPEKEDYSKLKVTELNYHPLNEVQDDTVSDGKNFEFIEFLNTGAAYLNVSGLVLDSAVHFTFPANTILAPGEYYVIASKPNSFFWKYGFYPDGNFSGNFSNGGEFVLLSDALGNEILSFAYSDDLPWPQGADGGGYSLTSVEDNPTGNPQIYTYWTVSSNVGGSPSTNDSGTSSAPELVDNSSHLRLMVYPNPSSGILIINALSGSEKPVGVTIYDMVGGVKYRNELDGEMEINLADLNFAPGIFFVKAEINGETVIRKLAYKP